MKEISDLGPVLAALTLVIGTSTLPFTGYLPSIVSYVAVLAAYMLFGYAVVVNKQLPQLCIPRWALLTLGVIWLVYIGHLFVGSFQGKAGVQAIMRIPAFFLLTGLNLFLIPQVVSRRAFFAIVARVSATLVVIGLPTLFIDSYTLLVIDVVSLRSESVPIMSIDRNVVSSIFLNPNTMSYVTLLGLLTAFGEFVETRGRVSAILTAINGLGLYLAHGRSSMLAGAAGVGLFVLYLLDTRQVFRVGYILGVIGSFLVLLAVFGYIPGPSFITNVTVTGRPIIWAGSVQAILTKPVFGYGAGETGKFIAPFISGQYSGFTPHNSYLRMFIETGVVGGFAYLLFVGKTLSSNLFGKLTPANVTTLVVCSAIAASMVLRGYTLFGISIASLLAAIAFGYGMKPISSDDERGTDTNDAASGSTTKPQAE